LPGGACHLEFVFTGGRQGGCSWLSRALCAGLSWAGVAARQDEGPVMVTEAEEVTDGLRTQARAAHQTLIICLPGTAKPLPRRRSTCMPHGRGGGAQNRRGGRAQRGA